MVLEEQLRATGDPVFDAILREIEAQDVEAILRRAAAGPGITVDGCDFGEYTGGGQFAPADVELMRPFIAGALGDRAGKSVFAARRHSIGKSGASEFHIWVSAGSRPSPTSSSTFWSFSSFGYMRTLAFDCDVRGAAQGAAAADMSTFAVPPRAQCTPGEAGVELEVIDIVLFDPTNLEIMAYAVVDGVVTADRVFVEVRHNDAQTDAHVPSDPGRTPVPVLTEFGAEFRTIYDIRDGKRIEVHGWRYWNCAIEAWKIRPAD